jgi:hypothetical protein
MPVKQFAVATAADIVRHDYILPAHIYKSNGIDVYVRWIPGASWTSGGYEWKIRYLNKLRDGSSVGVGGVTAMDPTITPDDATTIREDKLGNIVLAETDEVVGWQLYINLAGTSADDVGELIQVRFEFTAWRNGGRMHPGTISS